MLAYIVQRLMTGLRYPFGVAVMVFVLVRVIPGDAAVMMTGAGAGVVSEQELEQVRRNLGLDRPLPVQFVEWAGNVVRFDFGTRCGPAMPVIQDVGRRFPYTLQIVVMATFIAVSLGIPAGVLSAKYVRNLG